VSVAGVQSQSITVDRQMRRYNVPASRSSTSVDRSGANPFRVCQQLREKLKHNAVMIQIPIGLEDKLQGVVDLVTMRAMSTSPAKRRDHHRDDIPADLKAQAASRSARSCSTRSRCSTMSSWRSSSTASRHGRDDPPGHPQGSRSLVKLTPVCLGSAYKNKGVQPLLDGVCALPAQPDRGAELTRPSTTTRREGCSSEHRSRNKPLVMLAFKLEDGRYGQLTYVRVYQGTLRKGDSHHQLRTRARR
jgi:elongation factor G